PAARRHYAAIYDLIRDRMMISGGETAAGFQNDTYALSLSEQPTWAQIAAAGSLPTPRASHRAILDLVRDRMIMLGGYDGNYLNDTYALSLAPLETWSRLGTPSATGPTPRRDHIAVS